MISTSIKVSRSGPGIGSLAQTLSRLTKSEVYIGIPAEDTIRSDAQANPAGNQTQANPEAMNNASLLFIHTHGSPLNNIPPRPVLEPAVEDAAPLYTPELAAAAKAVLDNDPDAGLAHLKRAGMIGANAAKRWFTSPKNSWAPNAPSTIAAKGSDKPLIDTGQLRRSITSIIKTP